MSLHYAVSASSQNHRNLVHEWRFTEKWQTSDLTKKLLPALPGSKKQWPWVGSPRCQKFQSRQKGLWKVVQELRYVPLPVCGLVRFMALADGTANLVRTDYLHYFIFTRIKSKALWRSFSLKVLIWFNRLYFINSGNTHQKSIGQIQSY